MTPLHTICLFCGSAIGSSPQFREATIELANTLLKRKIALVYGGADVGLMKVAADTFLDAGGTVIGVMPKSLVEREVAHERLTRMHIVSGMQERKAMMAGLSDGFITLPGGFGTFDELFEMLSWNQLRMIRKPVGLLNINGYFDPLIHQLDKAVTEGFLRSEHRDLLLVDTLPGKLIDRMESFIPVEAEKWIDRLKEGKI
ncbi:MAG: TIGR00730 family Rossman fold protein [Bacteroidales bacterium]|nr:TIGR00730 family Rossman fold protein [Bacteroidales bacterium]